MFSQQSLAAQSIAEKKQDNHVLLPPIFQMSDMVIKFVMIPYMDEKVLAAFSQTSNHSHVLSKSELTKKANETLPDGTTRLASAIITGKCEVVDSLLKAKANVKQFQYPLI